MATTTAGWSTSAGSRRHRDPGRRGTPSLTSLAAGCYSGRAIHGDAAQAPMLPAARGQVDGEGERRGKMGVAEEEKVEEERLDVCRVARCSRLPRRPGNTWRCGPHDLSRSSGERSAARSVYLVAGRFLDFRFLERPNVHKN